MLINQTKTDKRILNESNLDTLDIYLYHDAADDVTNEAPDVSIGPDISQEVINGLYPTGIWVDGINVIQRNAYSYIKQITDYLFEVQFTGKNIDYKYANNYFKKASKKELENTYGVGACTGVVKDKKVLRHFDYFYNNTVEFIVRRAADIENGIHASVGVASGFRRLTKDLVESGVYDNDYKLIPFAMADGINDAGLYIQQNVVPKEGMKYNLNPDKEEECCITMLPRYILDHCTTFEEVEDALNSLHIYENAALDFGLHYLIAKDNDWRIIEFTNDSYKIVGPEGVSGLDSTMPNGIMTNFRTTDLLFDSEGKIDWSSVEQYGLGVERFEIGTTAFTESKSLESLREELKYSHLYADDIQTWKTEESGEEDSEGHKLTVMDSKDSSYDEVYTELFAKDKENWNAKTRTDGKGVWQTVHSVIYDLENKSFEITVQERLNEKYIIYLGYQG